jgi:hypothetical protein
VNATRLARAAVTGLFAIILTALLPTALSRPHHDRAEPAANVGPQQEIPGLTRAALVDQVRHVLPDAVVSTEPFDKSSKSERTYIDNTQDKSPTGNGGVSVTYNPDGTVWMVDCTATTPRPDANVVLRFCTGLDYTGANPPAIRNWVHTTFATPVNGLSLQQRRSQAAWILSVDNFGGGLQFGIDIQPTY